MTAQVHLPPRWSIRLLELLGAPLNAENLRFLAAWARAEGGAAQWNPLNTTYELPYRESWPYNSSKVQNYWTATGGIAATALTLIQDSFGHLLGDLQSGTYTGEQITNRNRSVIKLWGTNPDTILAVLAEG